MYHFHSGYYVSMVVVIVLAMGHSNHRLLAAPIIPNDRLFASVAMKEPRGIPEVMVTAHHEALILATAQINVLRNVEVVYHLVYPNGWHINGQVKETEFAKAAQCESVEVVDFQPPPGAGAAFMVHFFVQICAKLLTDSLTLNDFMRQTYVDSTIQFEVRELAGMRAYRAINTERSITTTWCLQTNRYRIQVSTAVVSDPDKQDMRLSQVQQILASLSFQ